MKKSNNTVLVTGGSSGIGLELSSWLIQNENKVLICGRSLEKLEKANRHLPSVEYFQCDLSKPEECDELSKWISDSHPDCNVLINNAATCHTESFLNGEDIPQKARTEFETNLLAPITLSKQLLPVLLKNQHSAIINITTGLIYAPRANYTFYNATKAGFHSFTQVLREQLKSTPIEVIEVLLPAVDTPWHKGNTPKIAISTEEAVHKMIPGMLKGKNEVRVGKVKLLYLLSRIAPAFTFNLVNSLTNE